MKTKLFQAIKLSFLFCGIILLASSCTEEKYYQNQETEWDVVKRTVEADEWGWDQEGGFFYCKKQLLELTKEKCDNGAVLAYRDFGNSVYKMLENTEYYYVGNASDGYYYSETVGYDFAPGDIYFYVKASDLYDNDLQYSPPRMTFKVQIIY